MPLSKCISEHHRQEDRHRCIQAKHQITHKTKLQSLQFFHDSLFKKTCCSPPAEAGHLTSDVYYTMSLRFFPVHISDCVSDQPADRSFFHFYFTFCPPISICYKSYSNASFLYTISKIFHKNCKLYLHFPYQNSSIEILNFRR